MQLLLVGIVASAIRTVGENVESGKRPRASEGSIWHQTSGLPEIRGPRMATPLLGFGVRERTIVTHFSKGVLAPV